MSKGNKLNFFNGLAVRNIHKILTTEDSFMEVIITLSILYISTIENRILKKFQMLLSILFNIYKYLVNIYSLYLNERNLKGIRLLHLASVHKDLSC